MRKLSVLKSSESHGNEVEDYSQDAIGYITQRQISIAAMLIALPAVGSESTVRQWFVALEIAKGLKCAMALASVDHVLRLRFSRLS